MDVLRGEHGHGALLLHVLMVLLIGLWMRDRVVPWALWGSWAPPWMRVTSPSAERSARSRRTVMVEDAEFMGDVVDGDRMAPLKEIEDSLMPLGLHSAS